MIVVSTNKPLPDVAASGEGQTQTADAQYTAENKEAQA